MRASALLGIRIKSESDPQDPHVFRPRDPDPHLLVRGTDPDPTMDPDPSLFS
jgi:hypothetical protein